MSAKEELLYRAARAAALGAGSLPLPLARLLGRGLGRLGMGLVRDRRRVALANLRSAFPEKGEEWARDTAKRCYGHLGMVAVEVCRLMRLGGERAAEITRVHGAENYLGAQARGKGVIGLTGHLGNWEWCGRVVQTRFSGGLAVARPLDSPVLDRLANSWRNAQDVQMVDKKRGMRHLLRGLRNGRLVYILLDQNVFWREGVWVDFFGRPAATSSGLALLALATKAAVVPMHCLRAEDGGFDLHFHPEVPLVNTGDRTHDIWANTQNYTRAIEDMIRQEPAQWLWPHNRYKTRDRCPWPVPEKDKKRWLN